MVSHLEVCDPTAVRNWLGFMAGMGLNAVSPESPAGMDSEVRWETIGRLDGALSFVGGKADP